LRWGFKASLTESRVKEQTESGKLEQCKSASEDNQCKSSAKFANEKPIDIFLED
jgi:hypothetical protein